MNETIKIWLENLYQSAIDETLENINNEHIWEFSYNNNDDEDNNDDYYDQNPHTKNIEMLEEYINVLEELKEELI